MAQTSGGSTSRTSPSGAAGAVPAPAGARTQAPPAEPATILLADDESALRRLVRRVLERQGYRVLAAESGEAALQLAEGGHGEVDLLLTDVVMPGMSGRELAERLLPSHPGMRLLYTSGYTDDEIVRHGVSRCGIPFLAKPFAPEELLRKVQEVLEAAPASLSRVMAGG